MVISVLFKFSLYGIKSGNEQSFCLLFVVEHMHARMHKPRSENCKGVLDVNPFCSAEYNESLINFSLGTIIKHLIQYNYAGVQK